MGLFDKLKKKEALPEAFNVADDKIVALADGEQIDVAGVSDPILPKRLWAIRLPLSIIRIR